ncbi:MAG TPA: hypothetical protein VJA21_27245 [Verrucomicrobiae bacterium]
MSALAAIHLAPQALAQGASSGNAPPGARMMTTTATRSAANAPPAPGTNQPGSPNNRPRLPVPGAKSPRLYRPTQPGTPEAGQLKPGVYESAPYTCIVVVPGAHPDDRSCVGGAYPDTAASRMPTITPGLRFIPRKP